MLELDEKDVKVVGNARFFRKWKWRMLISILPLAIIFVVCWIKCIGGEPTLEEAVILVGGFFVLMMISAIYWDIKQRRAVKKFVEEWKASG